MTLGAALAGAVIFAYSFVWLWVWAKRVIR